MTQNNQYCIIMAGGIGARFWPKSRQAMPKQFLDILGTGKSFIRHTFERFAKLDEFIPGTGLGLPLCRVVATILGGRVYVDTNYKQQGARFVFEIPENFA